MNFIEHVPIAGSFTQYAAQHGDPPSDAIRAAVGMSCTNHLPCLLCDRPTRHRGVYIPEHPESEGLGAAPAGKVRVVIYALCEWHDLNRRLTFLLVEEEIARRVRTARNLESRERT